jgi:hypothetical protein
MTPIEAEPLDRTITAIHLERRACRAVPLT